jgi:hypothetical protein
MRLEEVTSASIENRPGLLYDGVPEVREWVQRTSRARGLRRNCKCYCSTSNTAASLPYTTR